ncbi:hypothetical protein PTQ27_05305 [Mannheimia sp. AT1]|uniref:Uncharacterized protein n=1 Tax=Mannheimia cairinae TaxID=3025936 RepID=A0ABT5MQY9_9PAST|nr:hypothetical protein [Mannheimia cairinae]MDD0823884.1 hypothetical protein [Mannheimia cairinae]MDD0825200.1 hypothetical protein [Mannheimia cairinae]
MKTKNTLKHELNLPGITALMNEPIKATLSFLGFPHIRIERLYHDNGNPFFIGVLSLDLDDHINIEMAGATGFLEALAIIAYHQQLTATPLLVNDDLVAEINKLPPPQQINPFIDQHGNKITKEMMSKEYRKGIDLAFTEKRMKEGKE